MEGEKVRGGGNDEKEEKQPEKDDNDENDDAKLDRLSI
jgi:hypothetical protein